MEKIIGRKEELTSLQELYNKNGFQMAVLFGRRRVGKTTLINKFIETNKCKSVSFVSTEMTEKELLERMGNYVLAGECKFNSEKFDNSDLDNFVNKLKYLPAANLKVMLFSLSGFTDAVIGNSKDLVLVTLGEMY